MKTQLQAIEALRGAILILKAQYHFSNDELIEAMNYIASELVPSAENVVADTSTLSLPLHLAIEEFIANGGQVVTYLPPKPGKKEQRVLSIDEL